MKEKKRIIATKVNAKIFGEAQLLDMQTQGEWKKGDIAELLEKALKLYTDIIKGIGKEKELPEQIAKIIKSAGLKTTKGDEGKRKKI